MKIQFRMIGSRKQKLLNVVFKTLNQIQSKGINAKVALKYIGTPLQDIYKLQTKQLSGLNSELKQFLK